MTEQTATIPLSDANDLDAVISALGIEDSDTTPAEAVAELKVEIERLRAAFGTLEIEALRIAAMYQPGSDGRNTFVIFADKIREAANVEA